MDVQEKLDDNGKPYLEVNSDLNNIKYYVHKSNDGFIFYQISQSSGKVPERLNQLFTTQVKAFDALKEHLRTAPKSKTKERDEKYAARAAAKNSQQVQQGVAD